MFSPKVAYRVLRGKRAPNGTHTAETQPSKPLAEKPAGRDRIIKYLGVVGSILLFLATLSGIALALVGLVVVIILTIDPDNRYADLLQKINGGKIGKPKKKKQ